MIAEFRIHEASTLTGFTKYMLDYLAREDIFAPMGQRAGRGVKRIYSYSDIVLLRALSHVCHNRGRIRHLREALARFRDEFGPLVPGQRLQHFLFVQGDELCVSTGIEGGRQLRTGQLTLSFIVDLEVVADEIRANLEVDKKTNTVTLRPEAAKRAEDERQKTWGPIRARRENLLVKAA